MFDLNAGLFALAAIAGLAIVTWLVSLKKMDVSIVDGLWPVFIWTGGLIYALTAPSTLRGWIAMALLTFAADNPAFGQSLEPDEADAVQRLLQRRGTTATATDRHMTLYRNYLGRIDPGDRDLIVPSLVDKLALIGTRDELSERIAALETAGVDEIVIQPVVDPDKEMAALAGLTA